MVKKYWLVIAIILSCFLLSEFANAADSIINQSGNLAMPASNNKNNYSAPNLIKLESSNNSSPLVNGALPAGEIQSLAPDLYTIIANNSDRTPQAITALVGEHSLCFESQWFGELRINPKTVQYISYVDPQSATEYACFSSLVPGIAVSIDALTMTANLTVSGYMLQPSVISAGVYTSNQPVYTDEALISNALMYQLNGGQITSSGINSNQFGLGLTNSTALPFGSLVSNLSYATGGSWSRGGTTWETDFPDSMTSLFMGDISPATGAGYGSLALGGVQYSSNTALRPYVNFMATPTITGMAESPMTAQVLFNKQTVIAPVSLPAGPYTIFNLPSVNGSGSLTVNLQDDQGNIAQTLTLPYFVAPNNLKGGTYFYDYNFGFPANPNGGLDWGYQTTQPFFSTMHTYAFNDYYTMGAYGGIEPGNQYNLSLNHNLNFFNLLAPSFYTALSQSESGMGYTWGVQIARPSSMVYVPGISYTYGLSTPQFSPFGGIPVGGNSNQTQQGVALSFATDFSLSFNLGYSLSTGGALGDVSVYNSLISIQPFRGGLFLLQGAQTNYAGQSVLSGTLTFVYTFSNGAALSYGYSASSDGSATNNYDLGYNYNDPTNTWGYSINEQYNPDAPVQPNTLGVGGNYAFKNFNTAANVSYNDAANYSSNATLSGNIILARNGVNLARSSFGSFAIVKVGNLPNIGILQGDTYIGSTDRHGEFTVPIFNSYVAQEIKVRASDLPMNTELDALSKTVIPPINGGTMLVFKVVHYTPATVSLTYHEGKMPPVGYDALLINAETKKTVEDLMVIDNGVVMLSKFDPHLDYLIEFTVKSGTYQCKIDKNNINQELSDQYEYNLGSVQCQVKL